MEHVPALLKLPSNASSSALGMASATMGALAGYFYMRSKTETPLEDLRELVSFVQMKREIDGKAKSDWTVSDQVEEVAARRPQHEALCFVDDGRTYTWSQVNEQANQVAYWAVEQGFKQGDVVVLLMDNRPEFVFYSLGFAKIGVCCALINTYLTGKPLIHSLTVCGATKAIIGVEHSDKIEEIKSQLGPYEFYYADSQGAGNASTIDQVLAGFPIDNPPRALRNQSNPSSTMFLIYTSGTTGNPKASKIKHIRFLMGAMAFSVLYSLRADDRIYCCLPLYHSAGGIVGLGCALYRECTLVFRKKFSASLFWKDITEYNCTVFQYIGELCRYLLAQPPTPYDKAHKIRLCIGNGMRPDVWKTFQERFNIPRIGEFYGATEGNCNMANGRGRHAAVGYISPLLAPFFPIKLVRFDVEKEEPIRNKDGFCDLCVPGETGELLGKIDMNDPLRAFDGYTDKKASQKKILRDVFTKGDAWFRSGDLLRRDSAGYYYFVDRIGDTFRWKGENVSTNEVAEVISGVPGVQEVNVYGTSVPNHDGKAGMACIVVDNSTFEWETFYNMTKAQLPSYAVPLFVRIRPEIEITSTFKHKKTDLKAEGFDPSIVTDKLYFRDTAAGRYVPLDTKKFQDIQQGTIAKL